MSAPLTRVDYAACALVLASIALLPFGTLVHLPFAVVMIAGIIQVVRGRIALADPAQRLLTLLFLCLWLPMLLGSVDAYAPRHAWKTTLAYLHFLPAAWYLAWFAAAHGKIEVVVTATVAIVAAWIIDAGVQAVVGVNVLGFRYDGVILKGVFAGGQMLGIVVAVFAPLGVYVIARSRLPPAVGWLALALTVCVLALTLKRSAWVTFVLALAGYAWVMRTNSRAPAARTAVWGVVAAVALVGVLVARHPALESRLGSLAPPVEPDVASLDAATSYRISLWRVGADMFRQHWLNGVGPRGFRHAYRLHADPDDFWLARFGRGQTHPHLMGLEVAAETGVIGLFGLALFWVLVLRLLPRARAQAPLAALLMLTAVLAWLPLNVHKAFYDSWWASLAWWALALGVGVSLAPPHGRRVKPVPAAPLATDTRPGPAR